MDEEEATCAEKRRGERWGAGSLQRVLRILPVRLQQVAGELDSLTIKLVA